MFKHIGLRVLGYVSCLLILGSIISIHEAGHFLAAKLFGQTVIKYQIGFGPNVTIGHWDETTICLGVIPAGGYVRIAGDTEDAADFGIAAKPGSTLAEASTFAKVVIFSSGIFMNFLLAFVASQFVTRFEILHPNESRHDIRMDNWIASIQSRCRVRCWPLQRISGPIWVMTDGSIRPFIGRHSVIKWVQMISYGLAMMNLVPLPPLDGAQILSSIMAGATSPTPVSEAPSNFEFIYTLGILLFIGSIELVDLIRTIRFERMLYHDAKRMGGLLEIYRSDPRRVKKRQTEILRSARTTT